MTPISPLPLPRVAMDDAKTWKTARDFEAMALSAFLQPMFDTVQAGKSSFSGGMAEDTWRPMLASEIAKQIAAHGGLGLAAHVHGTMVRIQEGAKP